MTAGKAHKIFNDQLDKLSLFWIQARDKTAPMLSNSSHQETYMRKKEECDEIKAKPDEEWIYELYGKNNGDAQMHSVALVDIAKGGCSDEHFHPIVEETYMITEGKGKLVVDSEVITVNAGDAKVIPVGKMHQIFNEGSQTLKLVVVCVPFWTLGCGIYTKKEKVHVHQDMIKDKV
jgi:mannose-6-phosphate isomerase-like protein (cupin superfamily)